MNVNDVILPVPWGTFPRHALQIHAIDADGSLRVAPLGGGFEKVISAANAAIHFRRVAPEDQAWVWKPAHFDMDGMDGPWEGFECGQSWNGWACPAFTKEVAERVLASFVGSNPERPFVVWRYDADRDTFLWVMDNDGHGFASPEAGAVALDAGPDAEGDGDAWYFNAVSGEDIVVEGTVVHAYAIGACDYCWNIVEAP